MIYCKAIFATVFSLYLQYHLNSQRPVIQQWKNTLTAFCSSGDIVLLFFGILTYWIPRGIFFPNGLSDGEQWRKMKIEAYWKTVSCDSPSTLYFPKCGPGSALKKKKSVPAWTTQLFANCCHLMVIRSSAGWSKDLGWFSVSWNTGRLRLTDYMMSFKGW